MAWTGSPGRARREAYRAGGGRDREHRHAQGEGEKVISLIDEALSANATIANDYDPSRGKPPAPKSQSSPMRIPG